jgi:cytochrome c biogenesis DsbD-like protein
MSQSITNISLVAAVSAGLLSFVSPCVLPLVPSYISYITGLSIEQLTDSTVRSKFKKLLSSTPFRTTPRGGIRYIYTGLVCACSRAMAYRSDAPGMTLVDGAQ